MSSKTSKPKPSKTISGQYSIEVDQSLYSDNQFQHIYKKFWIIGQSPSLVHEVVTRAI